MNDDGLPETADAVVIGAGALGSATAFHLLKAGMRVAMLYQAALGSQTSPRAAGLSGQIRDTDGMTRIAARAVQKIETFAADTGEPFVFHQPGSLKLPRRPDHAAQLDDEVARGRRLGLDVSTITPDEARRLMPYLHTDGVLAVMRSRTDVYFEPSLLPEMYARACGRLGAAVLPDTRVTEIVTEAGVVAGVRTERGEIRARVVVDAAGAWLRLVASLGGATIELVPTRHQLMITVPLPDVRPEQPITRIVGANVYVRPCNGGLMLGGYERDPVQYSMTTLPAGFRIEDLPLDLDVLHRLAELVAPQFPIFRDVAIAEHRGGLPTMTADGAHVLGPAPGAPGPYVIGGCCVGGLSTAPALGELLAEQVTTGRTSLDVSFMAPDRLATSLTEGLPLERCRLQYAHHYWSPATMPGLA